MADPRIERYREILNRLPEGKFAADIPHEPNDEISALGASIVELAERLALRFEQERMLAQVSEKIVQGLYLKDVLDYVYDAFRPLIPYDRMGCALLEKAGEWVRACWARSDTAEPMLKQGFAARMAGSSLETIIATGNPRILNDLELYLQEHPQSVATQLIVAEGVRSSLTCPLIVLGRPVGFLFFSSFRKNRYESVHQEVFLRLSGLISAVVEKGRLYQELSELNRQLITTQEALRVQATHDALTGIWNRRAIMEVLGKNFGQARRRKTPMAVVLADIDHFKQVNDGYGHLAGDEVLRAVAGRLEAAVRNGDYVGRYGGEEFLVVLDACDSQGAACVAERVRQAVRSRSIEYENTRIDVTLSLGVAVHHAEDGDVTAETLVKLADDALYHAKRQGRDRTVVASGSERFQG